MRMTKHISNCNPSIIEATRAAPAAPLCWWGSSQVAASHACPAQLRPSSSLPSPGHYLTVLHGLSDPSATQYSFPEAAVPQIRLCCLIGNGRLTSRYDTECGLGCAERFFVIQGIASLTETDAVDRSTEQMANVMSGLRGLERVAKGDLYASTNQPP